MLQWEGLPNRPQISRYITTSLKKHLTVKPNSYKTARPNLAQKVSTILSNVLSVYFKFRYLSLESITFFKEYSPTSCIWYASKNWSKHIQQSMKWFLTVKYTLRVCWVRLELISPEAGPLHSPSLLTHFKTFCFFNFHLLQKFIEFVRNTSKV